MHLFDYQKDALKKSESRNRVAYYYDMGLGKTFIGSEKLWELNTVVNVVVCQTSKLDDWLDHFEKYYDDYYHVFKLTSKSNSPMDVFLWEISHGTPSIIIVGYDLIWRRDAFKKLSKFTLLLDESSLLQNEHAKRTKFILGLNPENVILLSGTPTSGKYENLWPQMKLLGWEISKDLYLKQYTETKPVKIGQKKVSKLSGYKNVERLKRKMRMNGCYFMKTEEVIELPEQTFIDSYVNPSPEYKKFKKNRVIDIEDRTLVGDTSLTKMLFERELCSAYNKEKVVAFVDLVCSTNDRLIVFYNFDFELEIMKNVLIHLDPSNVDRISVVNGHTKDLSAYEDRSDSITFIQYQAGSMGLNLQKANKVIYFSPTLVSMHYEQSKKRVHRVGQNRPCFYYRIIVRNSIEEDIYRTLEMRMDYTNDLFVQYLHE